MILQDCLAGTDALVALDAAHEAAWQVADQSLLTLCQRRIAMLRRHVATLASIDPTELDDLARWPSAERYGERGRAGLAFTEQWLVDVASITDAQADALSSHLGDQGLVDFVTALLVIEQRMSLELFLERVL